LGGSALLLKEELLNIPKIGVLNRHASLLPHFRGRVGSFWGHAQDLPEYGVTIHFVNEEIDAGPIVVQKKFDLDPTLSFAKILEILFKESVPLMLEAIDKVDSPGFLPLPNNYQETSPYRFPTLEQVQNYRRVLERRRLFRKR
jgi:methionyl-tRNA formyltransferase